jgi:hypothetical protein
VLLGYDYDGPWNPSTGLNAPLYLPADDPLCVVRFFFFDFSLFLSRARSLWFYPTFRV